MKGKLTQKRKAFADEYIKNGGNATQAAISAEYSSKTAYSQGQRLLKNVEVLAYIEKQMQRIEKEQHRDIMSLAEIGTIDDVEMYDRLIDHITDCENRFHHVSLPDASKQFDFYGYFSSIKDEVEKVLDSGAKYKGLSWKMTSKKPARTP